MAAGRMNYPMLYWFVPREVVGFVKFLLVALLVLAVVWLLRSFFKTATTPRAKRIRLIVVLLIALPVVGLLISNDIMEKRQAEARSAYVREAYAHFKQRCAGAHITYHRQVPPQDGVFIMKPGTTATSAQLQDQFWMGDPYDLPNTPENEASGLLYRQKSLPKESWDARNSRGGFDFVEAPHPDQPGKYRRFTLKPTGKKDHKGFVIHEPGSDIVDTRQSRYGYTWDDISTLEDRKYWVAGGRLRVVDLDTGEVVAERVGYVIERHFGATSPTFNQTPWSGAHTDPALFGEYLERYQTVCDRPLEELKLLSRDHRLTKSHREILGTALGTWNELTKEEIK